jgi:NAD(P)H-dependent FMN reductase
MNVMVVLGSVREGRTGEVIAKWTAEALKKENGLNVDFVDLGELNLPFFHEAASPNMIAAGNGEYTNPDGKAWAERVGKADAFVYIVAEYNHGYTAVLKNAIDWVGKEWNNKPVGFVSYGAVAGGARAVEQLRQVVLELRMHPLHDAVHLPLIWQNLDENRPTNDGAEASLQSLIAELKTYQK